MITLSVADVRQFVVQASFALVVLTLFAIVVSVPIQLWAIRKCLHDAPQPVWNELVRCLLAGARAMGPVQALVIKVTLPLGRRWWPPVSADSDAGTGPPPARS